MFSYQKESRQKSIFYQRYFKVISVNVLRVDKEIHLILLKYNGLYVRASIM